MFIPLKYGIYRYWSIPIWAFIYIWGSWVYLVILLRNISNIWGICENLWGYLWGYLWICFHLWSMGISGSNRWRYVNVPYCWPSFAGIFPYIGQKKIGLIDGKYLQVRFLKFPIDLRPSLRVEDEWRFVRDLDPSNRSSVSDNHYSIDQIKLPSWLNKSLIISYILNISIKSGSSSDKIW